MVRARAFLVLVALGAAVVAGCGGDDDDSGSGSDDGSGSASATATTGDGGSGGDDSGDGGGADLDFCEAVAALEVSFEEDEPALAAALGADTPAGLEDAVAVVREYTDRRQDGEDVFQDSDFLLEYDNAIGDLRDHCGL